MPRSHLFPQDPKYRDYAAFGVDRKYEFPDGTTVRTLTCRTGNTWQTASIPKRKNIFYLSLIGQVFILIFLHVGRMCEPLVKLKGTECNKDLSQVPANTPVKCKCTEQSRRSFVNGMREMSIMCGSKGDWTQSDVNCIRK